MRVNRYNFLFVIGLVLTLGLSVVMANGGDKKTKRPKNTGILSVKTNDNSYPVKVDGQVIGTSGVGTGAEFYLTPGFHKVEVIAPDGTVWEKEILIRRDGKECICLRITPKPPKERAKCPYRFRIEGPTTFTEGESVTFTAVNTGSETLPSEYVWKVSPDITFSGQGTRSITFETSGVGRKAITAELDLNENQYDYDVGCKADYSTEPLPEPPPPTPYICDDHTVSLPDGEKATADNCMIQIQNRPNDKLYVYVYPGTDRRSTSRYTYGWTSRLYREYLVKRGLVPGVQFDIVKGSPRLKTRVVIWVVPPGASPPPVD